MRYVPILLLIAAFLPAAAQQIDVMSYNIRYANPGDGPDRWGKRRADVAALINYYAPAFCGLQEALAEQVDYLDRHCPGYAYLGVGRDDGERGGEFSALLYDSTRFAVLEEGTFWLSPTPDRPSVGWDAALPRVCTYGAFRDRRVGDTLYVFNTHFDHRGAEARRRSAELIVERIRQMELADRPVVIMGDLNAAPGEPPIEAFTDFVVDPAAEVPAYGPPGTFTGFAVEAYPERRIDYVFVRNLRPLRYRHIDDRRAGGRWVSDHLPVVVGVGY